MSAPVKILFVCGQSNRRSLTAESLFAMDRRVSVRSAGLSDRSKNRLSEADVLWADLILAMERKHAKRIRSAFSHLDAMPPVESLDVQDNFTFMHPRLMEELKTALDDALERYHEERSAD